MGDTRIDLLYLSEPDMLKAGVNDVVACTECMEELLITLDKGDELFVAQLQGGRLPEGSTTLPEGFSFKFLKVILH